jgi:hypothetical protein
LAIFASGNDAASLPCYPAAYEPCISVSAISPGLRPAFYTNYGIGSDILSPGGESLYSYGEVLSTVPAKFATNGTKNYGMMQGTSQACPHVSAIAALGLSYALDNGLSFTLDEFKSKLLTSVNNFDSMLVGTKEKIDTGGTLNLTTYRGKMGTGKVDTYRFLMSLRGTNCIPMPVGQEVIVDFNKYMGDGALSVKVLSKYTISDETRAALGIENDCIIGDKLVITCNKPGCGIIKVSLVAGGSAVGGGQLVGGMGIEKEFALIVRENYTLGADGVVDNGAG